jgi:hypothetical protein
MSRLKLQALNPSRFKTDSGVSRRCAGLDFKWNKKPANMSRKPIKFTIVLLSLIYAMAPVSAAQSQMKHPAELIATRVATAPVIDGKANEEIWSRAKPLVTYDPLAKVKLTVRVVYTDDRIFILATFPDKTENRAHKTQNWVTDQSRYRISSDREDTFVIKWNMEGHPVDLRIDAEEPYKADIWYWKSHRTDHAGYADDKMHVYSSLKAPNSKGLISRNGVRFYLKRPGDSGKGAYKTAIYGEYVGDNTSLYKQVIPRGSRADVRAKGTWRDGVWTVEFARKLVTGNEDDVQFDIRKTHILGVSRFEIAGRRMNPALQEPYFGAGEITEILSLRFQ